ncbi:MAG: hypothetical protein K2K48_06820 [Anaeroplasmataceae bacterium]|nr:hypothetical protein [Anaeroplasmataceae bacterium]MDE6415112.1 hypothetical protein [Anaeroplasmataceae bacterium]
MKKRVIAIVLFLFCGLILSGSVFSRNEETKEYNVRNIILEDSKLDLSYYEDKYEIYNEDNSYFEITEKYQSNTALGKNSSSSELEVQFYAFVNKEEQYFIFSYEGFIDEEVVVSSSVIIHLVEYEGNYYFVSSNGCVTPYEYAIAEDAKGNCSCPTAYGDTLGLGGLSGFSNIRVTSGSAKGSGGSVAAGALIGVAAGAALASTRNNRSGIINGGLLPLPSISGSSAAGSLPLNPNGNKNNNNNKKILLKK